MMVAEARQFARERGRPRGRGTISICGFTSIVAIPLQQGFDLARVARLQADDRIEGRHRQVTRHQRPAVSDLAMRDAGRIAVEPREHAPCARACRRLPSRWCGGSVRVRERSAPWPSQPMRIVVACEQLKLARDRARLARARDGGTHGR